jgi:diaminopimelate decarboxylase
MSLDESDSALARFCRDHDWLVWVKGPFYEARSVRNWRQFQAARSDLSATWGSDSGLFVQEHISGREGSLALSSVDGTLVAVAEMMKREVTLEGKTWAGLVTSPTRETRQALSEFVGLIGWHGGAEVEFVQDEAGDRWIIEWNPRFPAWIHGATLAGLNLPGALLGAVSGVPMHRWKPAAVPAFARVVIELPTRADLPLPDIRVEGQSAVVGGKHPSGMPDLARRLASSRPRRRARNASPVDLGLGDVGSMATPARVFLARAAAEEIDRAAALSRSASTARLKVELALSIKTDPSSEMMALARHAGMMAEAISQLEARCAVMAGFPPDRVILNGPGKWWPTRYVEAPVHAVFFDSIEESDAHAAGNQSAVAHRVGPRLRLPSTTSRFGVPLEGPADFARLVRSLRASTRGSDLAVHFHLASSDLGPPKWFRLAHAILDWCSALEDAVGPVRMVDIGGGWHPDDWGSHLAPNLVPFAHEAAAKLGRLRSIVLEPGKALTQRSSVLLTRVLESRRRDDHLEIVADASIAELPLATVIVRQVFLDVGAGWRELAPGPDRILGRLCMEEDVLAANLDLRSLKTGDLLAFGDAGAYDRSMAYEFGRGC